jgi:SAM-dependent methyltransferase
MTLHDYYAAVRPFYSAEMVLRTDVPEWLALARRARARTILDLGCGTGRVGAALAHDDPRRAVIGVDVLDVLIDQPAPIPFVRGDMRALPFARRFDLVAAANDPFAHLLEDPERERAVAEARRVGAMVVIDGLFVREHGAFERTRDLADGTRLIESWRPVDGRVFETRYTYTRGGTDVEAEARVRSWRADEPALRSGDVRIHGGLDGRSFDPGSDRFVIVIGGAS